MEAPRSCAPMIPLTCALQELHLLREQEERERRRRQTPRITLGTVVIVYKSGRQPIPIYQH